MDDCTARPHRSICGASGVIPMSIPRSAMRSPIPSSVFCTMRFPIRLYSSSSLPHILLSGRTASSERPPERMIFGTQLTANVEAHLIARLGSGLSTASITSPMPCNIVLPWIWPSRLSHNLPNAPLLTAVAPSTIVAIAVANGSTRE